ncbi:MAG TPA: ABC transporter substrate-binding protein [Casimicrobiaceae bacterium]
MKRRRFLLGLSFSPAVFGAFAGAHELRKPLRIGFLSAGGTNADLQGSHPVNPSARALLQGLRDLGYRYGSDVVLEGRGGDGGPERYAALARNLVAANVDVIVAAGPTIDAVRRATSTIPVVMVGGADDPVEEKLVTSLAAPGGNITGLTLQQVDLVGKRLELLKEVVPGSAPIGILWEETSIGSWRATRSAAEAHGWQLLPYKVSDGAAIGPACASAKAVGAGSLLVVSGGVLFDNAPAVIQAATTNRLAAMYALRAFPEQGGLMSYAADLDDLYRRAATFVDRIAKGSRPATMPIEQPTKFDLVINMKAARSIGLAVPQSILLRADRVIQ